MTTTVIDGNAAGQDAATTRRLPRIPLIDQARGVALIAMAIYHFTWDLGFFGYIEPETAATGGWRIFARVIAGSFLFLVGFSLVLGHQQGFRPRPFFIRLGKIALAAAVLRRKVLSAMDQLRAEIQSSRDDAVRRFRRVHVTAILINLLQLVLIVWSLTTFRL